MGFLFLGRNSKATQRRTKMSDYEHPEVLVTTNWVAQNLNRPGRRLIEVDVDTASYDQGHIPGAVAWNWQTQLQDPIRRDLTEKAELERLLGESGISQDTTVLLYGDNNNWFAAYAFWQLKYYGHKDVKLINGGRKKWISEGLPLTTDPVHVQPTTTAPPIPTKLSAHAKRMFRRFSRSAAAPSWLTCARSTSSRERFSPLPDSPKRLFALDTFRERLTFPGGKPPTTMARSSPSMS